MVGRRQSRWTAGHGPNVDRAGRIAGRADAATLLTRAGKSRPTTGGVTPQTRVKFAAAGRMFFTALGLEQATDEVVAAYKARLFARAVGGEGPVCDLCTGIGGDLMALCTVGRAIAWDRDAAIAILRRRTQVRPARSASVTFEKPMCKRRPLGTLTPTAGPPAGAPRASSCTSRRSMRSRNFWCAILTRQSSSRRLRRFHPLGTTVRIWNGSVAEGSADNWWRGSAGWRVARARARRVSCETAWGRRAR